MNHSWPTGQPVKARFINFTFLIGLPGLLAISLLAGWLLVQKAQAASVPASWQKGVTLLSGWSGDFSSSNSDAAINQAVQANSNYLTLIVTLQQDNPYSTNIYKASYSPTDTALAHAIAKAHASGMKVTVKLHLDSNDGQWRAYINPSDRDTWFRNYSNFLYQYATLAQQNGVEQMVVGAELISMATGTSNPDNTQRWQNMISQVRQRFSGKLTYSANWGGCYFCEEFTHIGFWNSLDYIGISGYFEVANYDNPSVSSMISNWDYWRTSKIEPYQQSIGKPILFTEIGYRSVNGAASHPWDYSKSGYYDPQEQSNAIEALLTYWSNYSYFNGIHYWDWKTDPNCCANDTGYEVQNKPAYTTLKNGFGSGGGTVTPTFTLVSSSVTPSSGPAGTSFSLNAGFKASAASSALIDVEVYNSAGTRVFQQYSGNQSFTAGQTRTFTFNWNSPANQATGNYTLSVGVFTNDWSSNYLWAGNAGSFSISTGTAPTPTPTTAPANTPTPTRSVTTTIPANTPTRSPATTTTTAPTATPTPLPGSSYTLSIWWPANGVTLSGVQPFKARIEELALNQYTMYWQVDGGQLNSMYDSTTDGSHKQADVSVSGWNWRGKGPYTINFVAKDLSGKILKQSSVQIYVQ